MDKVNYAEGAKLYREFSKFRHDFQTRALKEAVAWDLNEKGEPVRPVVIVPFKKREAYRAEILKWIDMVTHLDQYPDLCVPRDLMYPVPNLLCGIRKATVYKTEAVNSQNRSQARLVQLIEKDLEVRGKEGQNSVNEAYIANLKEALAELRQYPEDEMFRVRNMGYRDLMIKAYFISSSPYFNNGRSVPFHVSHSGMFICDEVLFEGLNLSSIEKTKYSKYDDLHYFTCARWPHARIYRMKDVESA